MDALNFSDAKKALLKTLQDELDGKVKQLAVYKTLYAELEKNIFECKNIIAELTDGRNGTDDSGLPELAKQDE